ncbi:MAG: PEP-CTERM sorting domain-containing protein [Akkermansiaceae bacterium]|jgi:hypothetical protein|nr:PEP-CTERM sorting domain-containing protein [Akkermansiaceae bacterium]
MKTTLSLAAAMGTLVLAGGSANAAIIITDSTPDGTNTVTSTTRYVGIISAADAGSTNLQIGGSSIDTPPNIPGGQSIQVGDLSGRHIQSGSDLTWSWLIHTGNPLTDISFAGFAFENTNGVLGSPDTLTWRLFVDDVEVDSKGTSNDFTTFDPSMSTAVTGTKAEVILTIAEFGSAGDSDTNEWFNTRGTLSANAVPEPTTTALLGLGGLALILRRRK